MSITMQDIAEMAGCSRPAVAAVLNGSKTTRVSRETRDRILFLAKQFHYRKNALAHRLRSGCSERRIGIVADLDFLLPSSVIRHTATEYLREQGCRCIELPFSTLHDTQETVMECLREFSCSGALFFSCGFDDVSPELPSVSYESQKNSEIAVDRECGSELLVRHLIEHGHRRIAYLMRFYPDSGSDMPPQMRERLTGYRNALESAGIAFEEKLIYNCYWDDHFIANFTAFLKKEKITAVACYSDMVAAKLITILTRSGIRVPEEIAVTGFDGWSYVDTAVIPITTAVQPVYQAGVAMAQRLLEKLEGKTEFSQILLSPCLHLGHSCGCPESPLPPYLEWEGSIEKFDAPAETIRPLPGGGKI